MKTNYAESLTVGDLLLAALRVMNATEIFAYEERTRVPGNVPLSPYAHVRDALVSVCLGLTGDDLETAESLLSVAFDDGSTITDTYAWFVREGHIRVF
jgi:hypothetical protein